MPNVHTTYFVLCLRMPTAKSISTRLIKFWTTLFFKSQNFFSGSHLFKSTLHQLLYYNLFYYSSLSSTLLFLYSKMNNSCSSDCYVHFIHIACTNIIQNIESWVNTASLKGRVTVAIAKCGEPLGMIHEWWASCKAILNHWLAKVTYRVI